MSYRGGGGSWRGGGGGGSRGGKSRTPCRLFAEGSCKYGDACRYVRGNLSCMPWLVGVAVFRVLPVLTTRLWLVGSVFAGFRMMEQQVSLVEAVGATEAPHTRDQPRWSRNFASKRWKTSPVHAGHRAGVLKMLRYCYLCAKS
jgi:hypothetical protein